jgi:hypothetical protein
MFPKFGQITANSFAQAKSGTPLPGSFSDAINSVLGESTAPPAPASSPTLNQTNTGSNQRPPPI